MASRPPKIIEALAHWLVPAACREEVLGDLRQRYQRPAQYFFDAATTIPCVIYSRIRRTTDTVLLLMEWMSIYAMLVFATLWLDRAWLFEQWSYLRLAVPPAIILAVTILFDAYADPRQHGFDPVSGPAVGLAVTAVFANRLPPLVYVLGTCPGAGLVCALRVMFPPAEDRPLVAKIPAFWRRLELIRPSSLVVTSIQFAVLLIFLLFVVLGR